MTPGPAQPFLDLGCVTPDPAIEGRVLNINTAFSQNSLALAVADAAAMPTHNPEKDFFSEVPPSEVCAHRLAIVT